MHFFLHFHFYFALYSPAAVAAENRDATYPFSDLVATENSACETLSCHEGSWTRWEDLQLRSPLPGRCPRQLGGATLLGVICSCPPLKWDSWRTGSDYQQAYRNMVWYLGGEDGDLLSPQAFCPFQESSVMVKKYVWFQGMVQLRKNRNFLLGSQGQFHKPLISAKIHSERGSILLKYLRRKFHSFKAV